MSENSKYVTPQFKKAFNPKIGLITLSTDLTMESDFYSIIRDLPIDVFVNRIKNYNPLTLFYLKTFFYFLPTLQSSYLKTTV